MNDRYLPRVWTDEGYYYPVFSEVGITYENPKYNGDWDKIKGLDWVYSWILGESGDIGFKRKLEMPTGLKDKKDKLIYEGDIIEDDNTKSDRGVVFFDKHSARFMVKMYKYNQKVLIKKNVRVVGNIHEENKDE